MATISVWIQAARLRTLPLALASAILGSLIAASENMFHWNVFLLVVATTTLLQILSNFANDYGDFKKGTDNENRIGPERTMQSGKISEKQMFTALIITTCLTLLTGISLILVSINPDQPLLIIFFLLLGIGAIAASVKYTAGKSAYGYRGLGDVFVFVFFGLVGVIGTYFLHTLTFHSDLLLPASSIGLLSAGVLNMNNMRDHVSDKDSGKRTLVVMMGFNKSKIYHSALIIGAVITGTLYTLINFTSGLQFLFLIPLPILIHNLIIVTNNNNPIELNSELKKLALSTLVFACGFGFGLIL